MKEMIAKLRLILPLCLVLCAVLLFASCEALPDGDGTDTAIGTGNVTETVVTDTEPAATEADTTPVETIPAEPETVNPKDIVCLDPDFVYTYTDEQYDTMNRKIDRLYELLKTADPAAQQEFLDLYKEVEEGDYKLLLGQFMILNIQNAMYSTDTEIADQMVAGSEQYNNTLQRLIEMYDDIADSPYGDEFYKDWPDSERELAIRMARTYTDELAALKVEYDKLETEYNALPRDTTFLKKSAEVYKRAVEMNKKIAAICGYDNFMDYAYEMTYERDYTPADTAKMKEYVLQYLVPYLDRLYARYSILAGQLSDNVMDNLSYNDFNGSTVANLGVVPGLGDGSNKVKNALSEYFNAVNPKMAEEYTKLWADNHCILTYNSDFSRAGAFTAYLYDRDYPMIYFGPGYQGLFTVVHEYGHAFSMIQSGTSDIPMDLAEVHSQGSEWLFLASLSDNMTSKAYRVTVCAKMFNDVASIINCVAVNEFEMYVYSHDITDVNEYDTIYANILKELKADKYLTSDYWHYVTIDNAGYYISYAMSMVPSITLYAEACTDFATAAQNYYEITAVGENDTFLGMLEKAGISSPFEEKTYQDMAAAIELLFK